MIKNAFNPFYGFVEDIDDPEKNGRVRVRVISYHTENKNILPTEQLNWFMCLSNNDASQEGVGTNPKYNVGSLVFGFFIDEYMQNGVVIGAFNGIVDGVNDINKLARNEGIDETIVKTKKDNVETGVEKTDGSWDEPQTPYAAKYPDNKVTESNSGHITEVDDTEGSERLHVYHRSGSFYEIHPEGSQVVKIVKDGYTVIMGDEYVCIKGDVAKFVGGDDDLVVKGSQNTAIDVDDNLTVGGSRNTSVEGTQTHDVEGQATLKAPKIQLGEDSAVEPSVLGNQLANWIETELVPWLNNHQHIGNMGYPTSAPPLAPYGPFEPGEGAQGGGVYSKVNTNQ